MRLSDLYLLVAGFLLLINSGIAVFSQEISNATTNDRRNSVFGASRAKMFEPSGSWVSDRASLAQKANDQEGKLLAILAKSSSLENSKVGGMGMFLTVGRLQSAMSLEEIQGEETIVDPLAGELDIVGLNDVNTDKAMAVVSGTGMYAPRLRLLPQDERQIRAATGIVSESRRLQLSKRLNDQLGVPNGVPIELVFEGSVTILRGQVADLQSRKMAEIFLGFEPGISSVHNELSID